MIPAMLRDFRHIETAFRQNHLRIVYPHFVHEFLAGRAGVLLEQLAQVYGIQADPSGQIGNAHVL
ncbi:hypothetical protein D3C87_1705480 [compost metagenome]